MADTNEFERAARLLSSEQQQEAMRYLVDGAQETEAGIMRQLLSEPEKPLTSKQQAVFDKHIVPSMVEKCGNQACDGFSLAGERYCAVCDIKFG